MHGLDYRRALIGLQCIGAAQVSVEETWEYVSGRQYVLFMYLYFDNRIASADRPRTKVLPALLLSAHNDTVNARIATAVSTLHMTRSSKVFATLAAADAASDPVPVFPPGKRISAVISDCGLAASYMVPSPKKPHDYKSFLVTYTWDDDSTRLQHALAQWPEHISPGGPDAMFDAMLNRAYRQDPENPTTASKWWSTMCWQK